MDQVGKVFLFQDKLLEAALLESLDIPQEGVAYEVIRIMEGVPLYYEDHFRRLTESLHKLGKVPQTDESALRGKIEQLAKANGVENGNVKLMIFPGGNDQQLLLYISQSHYPDRKEIEQGVPVSLLSWERQDPNAKILNQHYKETVARKISGEGVFEVLLVNRQGLLTEGSRSNLFLFREGRVYTAPAELVLKGITRQYVLEACRDAGYEVVEKALAAAELEEVEGLFLSGTSIKVLPVSRVDGCHYDSGSHPGITAIRNRFDEMIGQYIRSRK